jgi:hypothetical protein
VDEFTLLELTQPDASTGGGYGVDDAKTEKQRNITMLKLEAGNVTSRWRTRVRVTADGQTQVVPFFTVAVCVCVYMYYFTDTSKCCNITH